MPGTKGAELSTSEQLHYLVTWFDEYSELQRDDFMRVLLDKYHPGSAERLAYSIGSMDTSDRPPTIFQCRMSLFKEWFDKWAESEREEFLKRIESSDASFVHKFRAAADGTLATSDIDSGIFNTTTGSDVTAPPGGESDVTGNGSDFAGNGSDIITGSEHESSVEPDPAVAHENYVNASMHGNNGVLSPEVVPEVVDGHVTTTSAPVVEEQCKMNGNGDLLSSPVPVKEEEEEAIVE